MHPEYNMRNANFVYRVVSMNVIDRPGMMCIEVLKDRDTGKTGIKIVQISDYLTNAVVYS